MSREKWTPKEQQVSEFTGKEAATALAFTSRADAADTVQEIVEGEHGDFLARAFTRISVKRTPDGWAVRVDYRYPAKGEVSP